MSFCGSSAAFPLDKLSLNVQGDPSVTANRVKLQQVLLNLLKNAAYAIRDCDDGQISLTLSTVDESGRDCRLGQWMRDDARSGGADLGALLHHQGRRGHADWGWTSPSRSSRRMAARSSAKPRRAKEPRFRFACRLLTSANELSSSRRKSCAVGLRRRARRSSLGTACSVKDSGLQASRPIDLEEC